jgi:hypothetical protein
MCTYLALNLNAVTDMYVTGIKLNAVIYMNISGIEPEWCNQYVRVRH